MAGRRPAGGWLAVIIALPTLSVLGVVFASLIAPGADTLAHLTRYVLPQVLPNTLALVACVGSGATLLGCTFAWLTTAYEFPGRRLFSVALLLPMALPGYVLAFVFLGIFDYAGPVHGFLRSVTGLPLNGEWIRGLPGLSLVLSLTLFPYVYLLARAGFASVGRNAIEAAQSLGLSPRAGFVRVVLPMARPWILGGALLVVMETLADFGTVSVFNYDTFTSAIYKSWFGMFSLRSALNLCSVLLLLVFAAMLIERRYARAERYAVNEVRRQRRVTLRGPAAFAATAAATVVLSVALVIPVAQLVVWAVGPARAEWNVLYLALAANSVTLAALAALTIGAVSVALAYSVRHRPPRWARLAARTATLGYALPGTVLAVGVFVPLAALGQALAATLGTPRNVLQGTLIVMLLAYMIRFMAVSFSPVENGLLRITRDYDEAAQLHGVRGVALFAKVHWPMLRAGVLSGMLLVFVDVMKEMPITLMTRPLGWETLAVRIFEKTSEGQWYDAAPAALAIVAAGLVPVLILSRSSEHASRA